MTNQQQNDLQEKQQSFLEEYKKLVDKYKMDFAQYPVWVPDGSGGFKTIMQVTPVSIENQPQKSPFVVGE